MTSSSASTSVGSRSGSSSCVSIIADAVYTDTWQPVVY
jgi:hypothetical protein